MGRVIYLKGRNDGSLIEMNEKAYDTEDVLQGFLAKYPHLLVGDQINPVDPRRWILVSNEASIPDEDGDTSLAVDHLFIDQDGIPTFVEVKRSSDTRIRREVVGQMLDYVSNAVVYWKAATLRKSFEETCAREKKDPGQELIRLLGPAATGVAPDDTAFQAAFWEKVGTRLQTGQIRMLFVADEIPPMLRRMVQFLNDHLDLAEVLAIEVKQYADKDGAHVAIVPQLVGQSERKIAETGGKCTEAEFEAGIRAAGPEYWKAVQDFRKKAGRLGGKLMPYKTGMGAYFPMGNDRASLVYIPCAGKELHPVSAERLQKYVDWGYFTPETAADFKTRFGRLPERLRKSVRRLDQWADATGPLDIEAYKALLDMIVSFYGCRVAAKGADAR